MKTEMFKAELQKLDSRLDIIDNPNRPGLSNIKLDGRDICPVPSNEIYDEPNNNYRYEFPNGMSARHKSISEALAQVNATLEMIKTEEGKSIFFGE